MTPWTAGHQASLSFTISQSLLKLMSIKSVMPSIFPNIRVFSNESTLCIRWPNYWSFSFSDSPSNEYLGLISFRIDWFDLLAVQRTLQESSPAPQFEGINSLALSLLFGPTLTLVSSIYLPSHDLLLKLKIPFLSILSFLYEVNILLLRCYLSSSSNCLLESPSLTSPMCM